MGFLRSGLARGTIQKLMEKRRRHLELDNLGIGGGGLVETSLSRETSKGRCIKGAQ